MNSTQLATLDDLKREIAGLKRHKQDGRFKPHKYFLLLAVLDLAEDGLLAENKIFFDSALWERFNRHFDAAADKSDWKQVSPPFWHLVSSSFWHHRLKQGREMHYATLTSSGGGKKRILDNIDYATLSPSVYELIGHPEVRQNLRDFIIALFSPEGAKNLES